MSAPLRLVRWAEGRLPGLARTIATPAVRGAVAKEGADGALWSGSSGPARAFVVYLTGSPATSRWLAGSIAVRLDALTLVLDVAPGDAADGASRARRDATDDGGLAIDAPMVVVGEGDAASRAVTASRTVGSRLALLYPAGLDSDSGADAVTGFSGVPTTLIQAAASGEHRNGVVRFERELRRAGVAVRETEYADVADGWARYPRLTGGSRRALDDLIAFLDRGIGQASTFDIIPGWDLH